MAYFTKRYHPPGTPPGTLVAGGAPPGLPLQLRVVDYSGEEFTVHELASAEDARGYLQRDTITWVDVQGSVAADSLDHLGEVFGLHRLALEDVVNTGQRPKVDAYEGQTFIAMAFPVWSDGALHVEQVSLFVGQNFLISFYSGLGDPFAPVRQRLQGNANRVRRRPIDYLLYALIDLTIDQGFPVLERFGDALEALEEEVLTQPDRGTLSRIHELRRELVLLRKVLWPQREVVNVLLRDDVGMIARETHLYLRDCYDHAVQIIDLIETYREVTTGLLDVYLSSISNRTNEVMRVLTIIATIFIPLTFIVGVYGMNFGSRSEHPSPWAMPELDWAYGYPMIWLVMVALALGMLVYFKRKDWM